MRESLPVIFYQTVSLIDEDETYFVGDIGFNAISLKRSIKENLSLYPVVFQSVISKDDKVEMKFSLEDLLGPKLKKFQYPEYLEERDFPLSIEDFSLEDINLKELSYLKALKEEFKLSWKGHLIDSGVVGGLTGGLTYWGTKNLAVSLAVGITLPSLTKLWDSRNTAMMYKEWRKYDNLIDKVMIIQDDLNSKKPQIFSINDFDGGHTVCHNFGRFRFEFNKCIIDKFSGQKIVKEFKRKNNPLLKY